MADAPAAIARQTPYDVVHLFPSKKLSHIHRLPFDRVIVFDNRLDTSKLGLAWYASYLSPRMIRLDTTAAIAVKTWLETSVSGIPTEKRTLYISLKQLRFEMAPVKLYFSADAYLSKGSFFERVATIKRQYHLSLGGKNTTIVSNTVTHALSGLIETAVEAQEQPIAAGNEVQSLDSVNSPVTNDWAGYAIMGATSFPANGFFPRFGDFRDNRIVPANFTLKMGPDSVYALSLANKADSDRWWQYNDFNLYAIAFEGRLYFYLWGKGALPITKVRGAYTYHIPPALPNMYAIYEGLLFSQPSNPPDASNGAGFILGAILQTAVDAKSKKAYQRVTEEGLASKDLRDCTISMDSGRILY